MESRLQAALERQLAETHRAMPCLGVNAALIDGRHGTWTGAAGWREMGSDTPMSDGARFYVYSITKTFVAARLLQFGIELDCALSAYWPETALPEGVTIRRLLNHTAGVPSYTDSPDYAPATRRRPGQPWPVEEVMERCCRGPLDFPSGEGWHYSNTGYMLLARLLERLSGTSLAATIAEGILRPLKLHETYVAEGVDDGRLTPGYTRELDEDERMMDVMPVYHPGWCLTGLIASTAMETARFYAGLMGGEVLDPAQLTAMATPVPIGRDAGPFFRRPSYGLGLMIDPEWGHGGLFGHGGGGPGATSWAMHLPDFHGRPVTVVTLCNTSMGGNPIYLAKDLLRVLATEG
ncbi:MAG: beta-lactamase family protein [Magnetospirillum sp.]|nr:beta-lactamase family protein [Magnetospirillum sp.]